MFGVFGFELTPLSFYLVLILLFGFCQLIRPIAIIRLLDFLEP